MNFDPFQILHRLGEFRERHVSYEELLAFLDCEVGRIARWRIKAHLAHCQECNRCLLLIEYDLQTAARMDRAIYSNDLIKIGSGLERLHGSIRRWETQGGFDEVAREPAPLVRERMLQRLSLEIGVYFGDRVAAAFLANQRGGAARDRNPLVEAESVLREFLGPGAASEVIQRAVHILKAMERHPAGSLPA